VAVGLAVWGAPAGAQPDTAAVRGDTAAVQVDGDDVQIRFDMDGRRRGILISVDDDRVRTADHVRFGESIHVAANEHILGDVVAVGGGGITVEGVVDGDCVAIGTSLRLGPGAKVAGEVVCVGGTLTLEDSAQVGLDAVSVWGRLKAHPNSVVIGELTEVGGFGVPAEIFGLGSDLGVAHDVKKLVTRIVWALLLAGLGILAFHLFPTRMERLATTVSERSGVSFLAGMAGWILWLPAFLLLCVTIIGIPVALLLVVFTPIMMLLGYAAVAAVAGDRVNAKLLGGGSAGIAKTLLIGVLTIEAVVIVARVFGVVGSVFDFLGFFLALLGHSIVFVVVTVGFGSFLITRFRPAPAASAPAVVSAPPSPPPPPAIAPYSSGTGGGD
jgi:hypothetical protein